MKFDTFGILCIFLVRIEIVYLNTWHIEYY